MNALILRPEQLGGVYDYLKTLEQHLDADTSVLPVGRRKQEPRVLTPIRIMYDLLRFLFHVASSQPNVVHLNPTMGTKSILREGMYLCLLRLFNTRVIVFFHGWNDQVANQLDGFTGSLFRLVFNRADCFVVLASSFRERLRKIGFDQPVHLETTMIPEHQIDRNEIKRRETNPVTVQENPSVLYLSRLVREKGLLNLAEACHQCRSVHGVPVHLEIAGDGEDRDELLQEMNRYDDDLFTYHGFVRGSEKEALFLSSSVFCLPTQYPEGLPISVLEAMAYGLPVLTTRVGGLSDHFLDRKNGFFIPPDDPEEIARKIQYLYENPESFLEICRFNIAHASNYVYSSQVSARIEQIYRNAATEHDTRIVNDYTSQT